MTDKDLSPAGRALSSEMRKKVSANPPRKVKAGDKVKMTDVLEGTAKKGDVGVVKGADDKGATIHFPQHAHTDWYYNFRFEPHDNVTDFAFRKNK